MVGYLRHMYLLLLRSPFWILHFIIKSCLYFLTFLLAALNSTFWDVKILFSLPFACNWHICMLFIFVFLFLIFRNCLLHNLLILWFKMSMSILFLSIDKFTLILFVHMTDLFGLPVYFLLCTLFSLLLCLFIFCHILVSFILFWACFLHNKGTLLKGFQGVSTIVKDNMKNMDKYEL